jgi:hypothetical protein
MSTNESDEEEEKDWEALHKSQVSETPEEDPRDDEEE